MKTKYELVVILDAQLSQNEKDDILKQVTEAVNKAEGKVNNTQVWLEKHKFTFRIKKCSEGTYYIVNFEGEGSSVTKIKQILRLNEKILRYTIMKAK